jgi:hypothetical protein
VDEQVVTELCPEPGDPVRRRDIRDAIEELYENNCARAEQMVWDTKTGNELPFPEVRDVLLSIRECTWELDRVLRRMRSAQ